MTRFQLDPATRTVGDAAVVLGGSPLRLFRLSDAGRDEFARIAAGDEVATSHLVDRLLAAGAIHPAPLRSTRFTAADVTVVVPTHDDDLDELQQLVDECHRASSKGEIAGVVTVDDESKPPVTGIRGASVVHLRRNAGPARARNAGRRAASTPFVAFVDSDVSLPEGWLDGLLAHFDDDTVALVAPRVLSDPTSSSPVSRYETVHSPLDLGPIPGRIAPGARIAYVPAAMVVVRAAALDEIGGFDESMRVGEDVDAVWRLVAAGWTGRYEPAVTVTHRPRGSWGEFVRQRVQYGESAAALADRHGDAAAPVRVGGWSLAAWLLAASGRPRLAAAVAGSTSIAYARKLPGVPAVESIRLAADGHRRAGGALLSSVRRTWMPMIAAAAIIGSPRARRVALVAAAQGAARGGGVRLLDDLAYSAGVWRGVVRRRQPSPLLPSLVGGRRPWKRAGA